MMPRIVSCLHRGGEDTELQKLSGSRIQVNNRLSDLTKLFDQSALWYIRSTSTETLPQLLLSTVSFQ
jgi:hypothetical protein